MSEATATTAPKAKKFRMPKPNGKTAAENAESIMNAFTPELLKDFWKNLKERVEKGDPKAMSIVQKMYYERHSPAVLMQVNTGVPQPVQSESPRFRSFEAIVRKQEGEKQQALIAAAELAPVPPPAEEPAIQEAEFVDVLVTDSAQA